MMRKMGALRQHLGPKGIPSFNGNGSAGGGSGSGGGSSSGDFGWDGSFMGSGYGFGGFGFGPGVATAVGQAIAEAAHNAGLSVDDPMGAYGGNPAAFGGGAQGNMGGPGSEYGGAQLGVMPGSAYLIANPDVARDPYFAANPMEHYRRYGQAEGRSWGALPPGMKTPGPSMLRPNMSPGALQQYNRRFVDNSR